jgi:hypothetical protein
MKVLVDIPDSKATFGISVLDSLSFVKKANPISKSALLLWENLENAAEDVRLHKKAGNSRKLSEKFAGALHLSEEQYEEFQAILKNSRDEWKRNIY